MSENDKHVENGEQMKFTTQEIAKITRIDGKFSAVLLNDGRLMICRVYSDHVVPVPYDEPLFLFRAKDMLAVGALMRYKQDCEAANVDWKLCQGMGARIKQFIDFALKFKERMKLPT